MRLPSLLVCICFLLLSQQDFASAAGPQPPEAGIADGTTGTSTTTDSGTETVAGTEQPVAPPPRTREDSSSTYEGLGIAEAVLQDIEISLLAEDDQIMHESALAVAKVFEEFARNAPVPSSDTSNEEKTKFVNDTWNAVRQTLVTKHPDWKEFEKRTKSKAPGEEAWGYFERRFRTFTFRKIILASKIPPEKFDYRLAWLQIARGLRQFRIELAVEKYNNQRFNSTPSSRPRMRRRPHAIICPLLLAF